MTKKQIARAIVDICKHDAAFRDDGEGDDPANFLACISDSMDERSFLYAVDCFLATFGVQGHLYFYKKDAIRNIGFKARRYRDSLFVTDAAKGALENGDEIIALDNALIPEVEDKYDIFFEGAAEGCSGVWEKIISYCSTATVLRDGEVFAYRIRTDIPRTERCPYLKKWMSRSTLYLRFDSFSDGETERFVESCREALERCRYLIIDIRQNTGGNDTAYLPLLKYLLKEGDEMCGKPIFTTEADILCTPRNVQNRIQLYQQIFEESDSEEVRAYLKREIERQRENMDKGFIPQDGANFLFAEQGCRLPEKVVVLIDRDCASAGEGFVEIVKKLKKVTLIGRPTMGVCDYSDLAYCDFGEYVLHYPTSRRKCVETGRGMCGRGLRPDILIPWSPEHIPADGDLAAALRFMKY